MKPLFYYPTTTLFLDDDELFLQSLNFIKEKIGNFSTLQSAKEAINFIKQQEGKKENFLLDLYNQGKIYDSSENDELLAINIAKVHELLYLNNKTQEISTVVVDYDMPEIDGISFCREIKDKKIKKILLTGNMTHKKAIEAFNEGVIDFFMVKNINFLGEKISEVICKMKNKYFLDQSFSFSKENLFITEKTYVEAKEEFLKNSMEFYLIDRSGSYVKVCENSIISWLVVWSESRLQEMMEIAISYNLSKSIISGLKARTHGIFLFSEIEKKLVVSEWEKMYFEIKGEFFHNGERFFYTIINDNPFSLKIKDILKDK